MIALTIVIATSFVILGTIAALALVQINKMDEDGE